MKFLKSKHGYLMLFLVVTAVLAALPAEAWAANNIFSTIRSRIVQTLKDSHQLVYLLAGFGLIGFAFMAIFNKISWKWFTNIAIGLFLVAVMGMFISYFTGDEQIAKDLDFGYDMGTNTSNPGTTGGQANVDCNKNPEQCPGGYTPPLDPNGSPGARL